MLRTVGLQTKSQSDSRLVTGSSDRDLELWCRLRARNQILPLETKQGCNWQFIVLTDSTSSGLLSFNLSTDQFSLKV